MKSALMMWTIPWLIIHILTGQGIHQNSQKEDITQLPRNATLSWALSKACDRMHIMIKSTNHDYYSAMFFHVLIALFMDHIFNNQNKFNFFDYIHRLRNPNFSWFSLSLFLFIIWKLTKYIWIVMILSIQSNFYINIAHLQ